MGLLPPARNTEIVVQELGKEILIYDLKTHKAYNLNETASIIYQSCDGFTSLEELKIKHKFSKDLIYLTLDELKKENLIHTNSDYISPFDEVSRREAIRRVGLATMIALPVISSLLAPTAAMAQSTCKTSGQICAESDFTQGECCSGLRCNASDFQPTGTCIACRPTGTAYSTFVGFASFCNDPIVNSCCNSGTPTFDPSSGGRCLCP